MRFFALSRFMLYPVSFCRLAISSYRKTITPNHGSKLSSVSTMSCSILSLHLARRFCLHFTTGLHFLHGTATHTEIQPDQLLFLCIGQTAGINPLPAFDDFTGRMGNHFFRHRTNQANIGGVTLCIDANIEDATTDNTLLG